MANPHLPGAADLATAKGAAATAPADGDKPKAAYRYGSQLRLCAPAHSGLPMNATAIVACSRHTSEGWRYDVTLTGGGPSGSGVRFVQNVAEGWLRDENRIATAKECAMRPWGQWVRSAPRLLVPIFQRRYCWGVKQQQQLWRDVASPRGLAAHSLGRVVVQRTAAKPQDCVVVDGQQRCTTLMLLLAAARDAAVAADAAAAAPLVRLCAGVLLRPKTAAASVSPEDGAAVRFAYEAGLEELPGAERVRFVPSREDRHAFCSLVLGQPVREGSGGAARLCACYERFRQLAAELLERAAAAEAAAQLERVVRNALERCSVVVFELHDNVEAQNMYEMFSQRDQALAAFFSTFSGVAMAQCDLVRNLLLGHVAGEAERVALYEQLWLPIERRHGDGAPQPLEAFLKAFLAAPPPPPAEAPLEPSRAGACEAAAEAEAPRALMAPPAAPGAAAPPPAPSFDQGSVSSSVAAQAAAKQTAAAGGASLLERFSALLAAAGGNQGGGLYSPAGGGAVAEGGEEAAKRAATELLRRMLRASEMLPVAVQGE